MRRIASQIEAQPYLPRSYIGGATPDNLYKVAAPPYAITVSDSTYSGDPDSGTYKVFVSCSGAASPRPVTVTRNNRGTWKAREPSSIIVGVEAPATQRDDDL